jgi:hypothetical protein
VPLTAKEVAELFGSPKANAGIHVGSARGTTTAETVVGEYDDDVETVEDLTTNSNGCGGSFIGRYSSSFQFSLNAGDSLTLSRTAIISVHLS